ncbi:MAG: hypothetical protein R3D67_13685 [Hyphomicrobiaceae bacterium]
MPKWSSTPACSATVRSTTGSTRNNRRLFGNDPSILAEAVRRSVEAKVATWRATRRRRGDRMLLNLGHTGHALEAWAGYSDWLLHGEAVAIGMAQAFRFSEEAGFVPQGTAGRPSCVT